MRVRARPVADRVDRDGEAVVLLGRGVVRLSALGTTLLDACAEWTTSDELTEVLVRAFGSPPAGQDPAEGTRAALRSLASQGLVELVPPVVDLPAADVT